METRTELAHRRLFRYVEKYTRFDRASLALGETRERTVVANAVWRFMPSFSIERSQRAGPLPAHATKAASVAELDKAANHALEDALAALPQRLDRWVRAHAMSDARLEPATCFRGTQTFGHQFSCPACRGNGRIVCPGCSGQRLLTCGSCDGSGWLRCDDCGGSKEVTCRSCGGRGKLSSGGRCPSRVACPGCNGGGRVGCGSCGRTGQVACWRCRAEGTVTCDGCAGTAWQHHLRVLSCNVQDTFRVVVEDTNREIVDRLRVRGLEPLRKIARTRQLEPRVDLNDVVREYAVTCDVVEQSLQAGDQPLRIVGFGAASEIFDYHGVVAALLEADLRDLERAVTNTRFRLWRPSPVLRDAAKQCLTSEANQHLAAGDEEAQRLQSLNIVTRKYKDRFTQSLQAALAHLYVAHSGPFAIGVVLVPLLLLLIAHFAGGRPALGLWVFPAAMAIPLAAWLWWERIVRKRIAGGLGPASQLATQAILRRHPMTRRVRGVAMSVAVALLAGGTLAFPAEDARPFPTKPAVVVADALPALPTVSTPPAVTPAPAVTPPPPAATPPVPAPRQPASAAWEPGRPHASALNVVASQREGKWDPAPGFRWIDEERLLTIEADRGYIGVTIRKEAGRYPVITSVLEGHPGALAGLQRDMEIRTVDGVSTIGLAYEECRKLLGAGPPGSIARIETGFGPESLPSTFEIVRR